MSPLLSPAALGLGTWKSSPGEVGGAVRTALELGYRHIDCASIYGNEAEIGQALAGAFRDGVVQRDQLWITSKLWNDCHAPEDVRPALLRSLSDLQLEQLDLYLIHWPVVHRHGVVMPEQAADQIPLEQLPLSQTWGAMEALVEEGLVRQIGVSNCSAAKIAALLPQARHRPMVNQVERHPWLQQNALLQLCQREGIGLTAYSPLGSPSGAGQAPLLAAAEALRCLLQRQPLQPHLAQHPLGRVPGQAPLAQLQLLAHRQAKEMAFGELKDQTTQPTPLAAVEFFPIPGHRAGLGLRQTADHLKQGGFAATTRTCHQGRSSDGQLQIDLAQHR